jgi:hypothetical protein
MASVSSGAPIAAWQSAGIPLTLTEQIARQYNANGF